MKYHRTIRWPPASSDPPLGARADASWPNLSYLQPLAAACQSAFPKKATEEVQNKREVIIAVGCGYLHPAHGETGCRYSIVFCLYVFFSTQEGSDPRNASNARFILVSVIRVASLHRGLSCPSGGKLVIAMRKEGTKLRSVPIRLECSRRQLQETCQRVPPNFLLLIVDCTIYFTSGTWDRRSSQSSCFWLREDVRLDS